MLSHEGLVQNLVNFIIGGPLVADDMIGDGFNELVMQVVSDPLLLQIGVGVRAYSLCIVKLHMNLIRSQHVQCNEVHNCLLPGVRGRKV